MNYVENCIIFVPEFCNIMTTGGIFESEQSLQDAMRERNYEGDVRYFKIFLIQDFIKEMITFRVRKGVL